MISWKEYLDTFVEEYRREFEKLFNIPPFRGFLSTIEPKQREKATAFPYILSFLKPCQILVYEFKESEIVIWQVENNVRGDDKHFAVKKEEETIPENALRGIDPNWEVSWPASIRFQSMTNETKGKYWIEYDQFHEAGFFKFPFDPRERSLSDVITTLLGTVSRDYVYGRIENATETLRMNIKEIVDKTLQEKMLDGARDLELSFSQIKNLDKQMMAIRKLMRTSEDFKDVLVLIDTVNELRKNSVNKEVLNEKVKRLDGRIDAFNTRIEDLKAIKFWSKRTVLEMVLAIWGAIITLYATGVLKF